MSRPFNAIDREVLRILRRALFALNSLSRERVARAAQKRAEAERARLQLSLLDEARRSSMGELAAALAHELNQPLAAVTNYVNAARQELRNYGRELPGNVDSLINEAVAESSRAANLVRRLRNFIAGGELVREAADLESVVRHAAELAMVYAGDSQSGVDLHIEFDEDCRQASFDALQIGQVVLNLVRNSLGALQDKPAGRIEIRALRRNDAIVVSVIDNGPGIAPEIAATMFEPFQTSRADGMGIGLSLSRSIVEAHGGEIWNVARNQGAEVAFSLPVEG